MTATHRAPTVVVAVLLVLSAVATPALAGGDGGLTAGGTVDDGTSGITHDGGNAINETTDTVSDATQTVAGSVDDTVDETEDSLSSGTRLDADTDLGGSTEEATTDEQSSGSPGGAEGGGGTAAPDAWRTVGHDPAHTGANPATTGPRLTLGTAWVAGPTNVSGTPVVADDSVYAVTDNGTVVALSRNGSTRWRTTVDAGPLAGTPSVDSSPAVGDERVFVTVTGRNSGYLVGLNASTGTQAFSLAVGSNATVSPVVDDSVVYVGSAPSGNAVTGQSGPLTAVYANGTEKWTNANLDAAVAAAPAVTDSFVYAATTAGTLYELDRETGSVVERASVADAAVTAPPTVAGDRVYVAAGGTLSARNASTLAATAAFDASEGDLVGSPVVSQEGVYVATTSGSVVRLNDSLVAVDETTTAAATASPSMAAGTLYVPTGSGTETLTPGLEAADAIDAPAPTSGAVTPSAGLGFVGTDDGVVALTERCDRSAVGAETVHVPDDCSSLGSAVEAVAAGGTVLVGSGTYDANVTVSKPLTLRGEDAVLDSESDASAAVTVAADDVTVAGFTVRRYTGAAVRVEAAGNVTVRNLSTKWVARGVSVAPSGGEAAGVTVLDSHLGGFDTGVALDASAGGTVSDVEVVDGTLESAGRGYGLRTVIADGGTVAGVTLRDVTILDRGGALFAAGAAGRVANVTVEDTTFASGDRGTDALAFVASPDSGAATVENVVVRDTGVTGDYDHAVRVSAATEYGSAAARVANVTVDDTVMERGGDGQGLLVETRAGDDADATPTVRDVAVTDSRIENATTGVLVDGRGGGSVTAVSVTDSTVVDNRNGLLVAAGDGDEVALTGSTVTGNAEFGVRNDGTGVVNATHDRWGAASGPHDAVSPDDDDAPENPDGTGDNVSDGVAYRPWVTPGGDERGSVDDNQTDSGSSGNESDTGGSGNQTDTGGNETDTGGSGNGTDTGGNQTDSGGSGNETDTGGSGNETDSGGSGNETGTGSSGSGTDGGSSTSDGSDATSGGESTSSSTGSGSTSSGASGGSASGGGSGGGAAGGGAAGGEPPTATPAPTGVASTGVPASATVERIAFDAPVEGNVSATDLDSLPADVTSPGEVLSAVEIAVPPAAENTSATITFSVSTDALDAAGVAPGEVRLARYHGGWQMLDTQVVDRSGDSVTFAAATPGFSVFAAVASQAETPTPTAIATATATPAPTASPSPTRSPTAASAPAAGDDGDGGTATPTVAAGVRSPFGVGLETALGAVGLLAVVALLAFARARRDGGDYEPDVRS